MEQVEELSIKKENKSPLSVTHPEIAKEWSYSRNKHLNKTPETISYGSNLRATFKCNICGHYYNAVIKKRTTRGQKCPECKGMRSHLLKSKQVEIESLEQFRYWIRVVLDEHKIKRSERDSSSGYYFETRKVGLKEETIYLLCYKTLGRESRFQKLEEIYNLLKKYKLAKLIKLQPDSILLKHNKLSN